MNPGRPIATDAHSPSAAGMPFAQRRELLARPDAAATVDRLTGALNGTERPELHIELIALAVLRARQAAERVGKRIVDGALLGGETKAW